ncbi:hypothetical protein TCAL_14374 [Tigriopus californicus]|uniref:THAP-type domain-containing protein n=1 Tax=Tigriopus californicus TaxID=6832 RepID=A0A553PKW0_TIGCA|nr:uncharacterized protein LOC131889987 [Tigriopus californicus]TRY78320.1 hypothetical protein TCAL_14374 [Tigriopus californicus]
MARKCVVPFCKSGYNRGKRSKSQGLVKVGVFQFPVDPTLRKQWIDAIPRENWGVMKHSGVCALHFSAQEVVYDRLDGCPSRARKRPAKRLRPSLRIGAIPKLFPTSTASAQILLQNRQDGDSSDAVRQFATLGEFDQKLELIRHGLPGGVRESKDKEEHVFYKLKHCHGRPPMLLYSFIICKGFDFTIWLRNAQMSQKLMPNLLSVPNKITRVSEVKFVLEFLEDFCRKLDVTKGDQFTRSIDLMTEVIETCCNDKEPQLFLP